MRCPKCKYEPTMAEQTNNKDQCPSCGIFYAKYMAHLKAKSNADSQTGKTEASAVSPSLSKKAVQAISGSQPVVVVDIQMKFWSMVVFMVKWAFAAIPALIIIAVIVTLITMFSAGFIAGIGKGSKSVSTSAPVSARAPVGTYDAPKTPSREVEKKELITAVLLDKGFSEEGYTENTTLKISFENITGREIRAFEGVVLLSDLLGNDIKRVKLSDSEPRWVGNKLLWEGSIRYNQFMQDDVRLKGTSIDGLRMAFEVKKILYADGELQEF